MNIQPLRHAIAERKVLDHAFYQRWNEGQLDQETLKVYAAQYYQHVLAFPRYLSAVHSQCDDAEVRQLLLENLIEEERGTENHPELWMRFCESLGLTRDEVKSAKPLPATQALTETFFGLCGRTWQEGLAALYAYESQIPEVSTTKKVGLSKFYGVTSERGLSFFTAHEAADVIHRQVEEQVFTDKVPEAKAEAVLSAGKSAARALLGFLDGMMPEALHGKTMAQA